MNAKCTAVVVDDLAEGIQRLYDNADANRSLPLLIVAAIDVTRNDLGLVDPDLLALGAVTATETPATLAGSKWRGGPVLAVGLGPDALDQIAADARVALIVAVTDKPSALNSESRHIRANRDSPGVAPYRLLPFL